MEEGKKKIKEERRKERRKKSTKGNQKIGRKGGEIKLEKVEDQCVDPVVQRPNFDSQESTLKIFPFIYTLYCPLNEYWVLIWTFAEMNVSDYQDLLTHSGKDHLLLLILFNLVGFYGISTIVGYLIPNLFLYIYIKYMISKHILLKTFLNESEFIFFFFCIQLNGFTYLWLIWIILFTINHLFAHSLMFSSIAMYPK